MRRFLLAAAGSIRRDRAGGFYRRGFLGAALGNRQDSRGNILVDRLSRAERQKIGPERRADLVQSSQFEMGELYPIDAAQKLPCNP